MTFQRFMIICFLINYCKAEINKIGLGPWAWFWNGVHDFNSNKRGLHIKRSIKRWMKACMPITQEGQAWRINQHQLHSLQSQALRDRTKNHVRLCNGRNGLHGSARGEGCYARQKSMQPDMVCLLHACNEWRRV
jgi:hypothetical protein